MFTFFIILLIIIPLLLCCVGPEGFFVGLVIDFFIFVVVGIHTDKPIGYIVIDPQRYTVETTVLRQYIYIKGQSEQAVTPLIFDKVEQYNLIKSGNFQVVMENRHNFIGGDYQGQYKVMEKAKK